MAAMPSDVVLTQAYEILSTSQILWYAQVYTGQLESLLGRWAGGDYEILQVNRVLSQHTPQPMASAMPLPLVPRDC